MLKKKLTTVQLNLLEQNQDEKKILKKFVGELNPSYMKNSTQLYTSFLP
jgi:hypothetical protein